jgi:hypothetical protein
MSLCKKKKKISFTPSYSTVCWRGKETKSGSKKCIAIRGPFEKFLDWRQCTAVMQREAVDLCKVVVLEIT